MLARYLLATLILLTAGCSGNRTNAPAEDRDRQFRQQMSGVMLVGRSTRWDREGLSGEERYTIDKVSKVKGDTWVFHTRLKYGATEIPVPIPLTVLWAGDTPVITLTDLSIPNVGVFTARVLLYRDQYAGAWSGEGHGGQLFGRIVRGQAQ